MQNEFSGLPRVPYTVPIPGLTSEEYREYLSWRIEIQVLATIWKDWKQSTSGGEREKHKGRIISQLIAINRRADCFPMQPLPDDIPTTVQELTDPGGRPGILSVPVLIRELWQVFI